MTSRNSRFWIVGAVLIGFNGLYVGYKLVSLKQPMTIPEMLFHGAVLLVAIATFDRDLAKEWADRVLVALGKKGNTPPPPAEG
jgi:hypothetical protein